MRRPVTIQVSPLNPAALRVASKLRSHPRLQVELVTGRARANVDPRGRVLRIEMGSRLEPVLALLWGAHAPLELQVQRDARLGLSAAVLGRGPVGYEWSGHARPLPERACVGSPDLDRPWVLVAPHARIDSATVAAVTGLSDPQLHYLKPLPASGASSPVWWLPTRNVLLSLLGRVHSVVASQGPLAWDAARIGVPVIEPEPVRALPAAGVERRLSAMVPAKLLDDDSFWDAIGNQLADGISAAEWGTAAWTLRARDGGPVRASLATGTWQRKLLKLRRDPARFWADSKVVKRLSRSAG